MVLVVPTLFTRVPTVLYVVGESIYQRDTWFHNNN